MNSAASRRSSRQCAMGESLRFGTAGVPHSSINRSSVSGIAEINRLGLNAMELEFVRRVAMGPDTAALVRRTAADCDVRLSCHAPYYLNLNSPDTAKLLATHTRLMNTIRVAAACGARNVVFHPAYYHQDAPSVVYLRVRAEIASLTEWMRTEGLDVCLRPETMGRASQFGSLEETLRLCSEIPGCQPCLDIGHLYARSQGRVNSFAEFCDILESVGRCLGDTALQDLHIHVEGMAYGKRGEREHLNLQEAELDYRGLVRALVRFGAAGTVICESPNLEEDARRLQQCYHALLDPPWIQDCLHGTRGSNMEDS